MMDNQKDNNERLTSIIPKKSMYLEPENKLKAAMERNLIQLEREAQISAIMQRNLMGDNEWLRLERVVMDQNTLLEQSNNNCGVLQSYLLVLVAGFLMGVLLLLYRDYRFGRTKAYHFSQCNHLEQEFEDELAALDKGRSESLQEADSDRFKNDHHNDTESKHCTATESKSFVDTENELCNDQNMQNDPVNSEEGEEEEDDDEEESGEEEDKQEEGKYDDDGADCDDCVDSDNEDLQSIHLLKSSETLQSSDKIDPKEQMESKSSECGYEGPKSVEKQDVDVELLDDDTDSFVFVPKANDI